MDGVDVTTLELAVPLEYVILYVLALTLCLFLKRNLLGIVISYLFVLYMGFFYNPPFMESAFKGNFAFFFMYVSLGILLAGLATIGIFMTK